MANAQASIPSEARERPQKASTTPAGSGSPSSPSSARQNPPVGAVRARQVTWRDRARCAGADPDMFFDPAREAEAKAVCAKCPVRQECLDDEMAVEQRGFQYRFGVRGGLTGNEREKLSGRPAKVLAPCNDCGVTVRGNNSSGLCRQCWNASTKTPRTACSRCSKVLHRGGGETGLCNECNMFAVRQQQLRVCLKCRRETDDQLAGGMCRDCFDPGRTLGSRARFCVCGKELNNRRKTASGLCRNCWEDEVRGRKPPGWL